ncbi:VOC family protein [Oceaniradius stylonematis]|uniref:VOC family protein n=1 Tax=Oceaniradius stylonematis TaxID=2184161 RepID=UPI00320494B6
MPLRDMLKLDHITVIAPTLADGVAHVRDCLGIEVPFGTRHDYMGTHNHRLQLGGSVYLEIVARDPMGSDPGRPRWFGLDDQDKVRTDWSEGRRLRGWVANAENLASVLSSHPTVFGEEVSLPTEEPAFGFTIPPDGALPLDGAAPSIIDHRGDPTSMAVIPDLGARLHSWSLEHPEPVALAAFLNALCIDRPPKIIKAPQIRYRARIETPTGMKELT